MSTISSLNGQLCGALHGIDSAPREWIEALEQTRSYAGLRKTALEMTELLVCRTQMEQRRVTELLGLVDESRMPSGNTTAQTV